MKKYKWRRRPPNRQWQGTPYILQRPTGADVDNKNNKLPHNVEKRIQNDDKNYNKIRSNFY